jgi:tetratricopeptide (TPR) repeat protein
MKLLCVATALFALLVSVSAAAQTSQELARQKFGEAVTAHKSGDFQRAAALFEEAYRLAPAAGAKFNAAASWDSGGDLPRAADAYAIALEMGGLSIDEAKLARGRLSALKQQLGYVSIDEPAGALVSIAHVESAPVPLRVHVQPGTHPVRVELHGGVATSDVQVGAGEVKQVALKAPPGAEPEPRTAPPAATPPVGPRPTLPPERIPIVRDSAQQTWGWVVLGTGVALAGVAVFLGLETLSAREDWDKAQHDELEIDKHDRAVNLRTWTNVAWGGSVLAGGIGLTLLLTTPKVEF